MAGPGRGRRRAIAAVLGRVLLSAIVCGAFHPRSVAAEVGEAAGPAVAPLPKGVRVIEIKGTIRATLAGTLRAALAGADQGRFPAGVLILLDSRGGDGLAALEAGRVLRDAKAHVFVRERCASACVFILAAGVVRGVAPGATIAIHRPRLTTFVKGMGTVEINPASNPRTAMALDIAHRRTRDYLADMGMPDELFAAMLAVPTEPMRTLDAAELAGFRLTGIDPAYLADREAEAAAKYGISFEEFRLRTARTPERCLAKEAAPREIVRCYLRMLRTGS